MSEGSGSDSDADNESQDGVDVETDEDDIVFFDTNDFLSSESLRSASYRSRETLGNGTLINNRDPFLSDHLHDEMEIRTVEYPYIKRRDSLPEPKEKEKPVGLWSIIKDNIGKDLSGVCLPVYFNEPLSSLNCRTRAITLAQTTLEQNAEMFGGNPDSVPSRAITMGTATILESHMALMVVTGPAKAQIAAQMIEGPVTAAVPGSALQYHPSCLVILDEDAASALASREAIDWQMKHDPELMALTDCL